MPLAAPVRALRPAPLKGAAPSWAAEAQGPHLWDAHGRRHLDMSCAGGAALLGHAEPRVEAAAADPAQDAEARAAHALAGRLTAAGGLRFTACAQDARRAAITLAVRATDRVHVIEVAGAEDLPSPTVRLSEIAAFMVDVAAPPSVMHRARVLASAAGALLILDDTASGLRRNPSGCGGPDLTVLGDALANGRPIGAVAGEVELLAHLPDLQPAAPASLAAAAAVLSIVEREDVALQLAVRGAEIQAELEAVFATTGAAEAVQVGGDPTGVTLRFGGPDAGRLRRRFLAQLSARGVHAPGVLHVSTRHGDAEIGELLDAVAAAALLLAQRAPRAA